MCRERPGLQTSGEGNKRQHHSHGAVCVDIGGEDVILEVRGALLVTPSSVSPAPNLSLGRFFRA
jgi:hypothetical protein